MIAVALSVLGLGYDNLIPGFHLGRASGGAGSGNSSGLYDVTFTQSGLPAASPWEVTLNGTMHSATGSPIQFVERNGSYLFHLGEIDRFTGNPTTGTVEVVGAPVSLSTTFGPSDAGTSRITFTETGLPGSVGWSITLGGTALNSTTGSIEFLETNGTYSYSVGSVPAYRAAPNGGTIGVNGTAQSVSIVFTKISAVMFSLEFFETGLSVGTSWSVNVGGSDHSSAIETVALLEPNGTYPFTVGAVSGFSAAPAFGSVAVAGRAVVVPITFSTTNTSNSTPIGTAFGVGNPILNTCSTGSVYGANLCQGGDYVYTLTIESSTVTFGSVLFEVKSSGGVVLTAASAGGFSIADVSNALVTFSSPANRTMAMTSGWAYVNGTNPSTPITNLYTIVIDVGNGNPAGQGYTFQALGTGSYSGTTSPLSLP
ncbi:MAG: hypothetical protein L3K10_04415 [Thermoplasmata archaeon]|nr:hypothetical protein [Thermoplasmata archaeon]